MKALVLILMMGASAYGARINASAQRSPRVYPCDSVADTLLRLDQSFEGLEDRYVLVLVKRNSVRTPARTFTGSLYLWRASPTDSNARGERPHPRDDALYFGTTDVDLGAADADFSGFWRNVHEPTRNDVDAIHPPIKGFVLRNSVRGTTPWVVFWLAIGTVMNDRDRTGVLDGAGVVFDVLKIDSRGLFGTWDSGGIVRTGRGYFCAYRKPAS